MKRRIFSELDCQWKLSYNVEEPDSNDVYKKWVEEMRLILAVLGAREQLNQLGSPFMGGR